MMDTISMAKEIWQRALGGPTPKRATATRKLFDAVKASIDGFAQLSVDDEGRDFFVRFGTLVRVRIWEAEGKIWLQTERARSGKESEKQSGLVYEAATDEWVGPEDETVVPTQGQPFPRIPGVLQIVERLSGELTKPHGG